MPRKKINYTYVKRFFEDENYVLLEKEYKTSTFKMRVQCPEGHQTTVCWSNFNRGTRCTFCTREKLASKLKLSYSFVKEYFEKNQCILLESSYKNATTKMRYLCSCGREAVTTWSRFNGGHRCRLCFNEKHSKALSLDPELVAFNKLVARRCNSMVRRILKGFKKEKRAKCVEILGYSHKTLRDHITHDSNWPALQGKTWSIDHIFPVKAFLDFGINDLALINCLDNLRPILLLDNLVKSDSYSKEDFLVWLKTKYLDKI